MSIYTCNNNHPEIVYENDNDEFTFNHPCPMCDEIDKNGGFEHEIRLLKRNIHNLENTINKDIFEKLTRLTPTERLKLFNKIKSKYNTSNGTIIPTIQML